FKLLMATFYVGTVVLLYRLSKSIVNTAFFALNPLVLIETIVSGHNDMSMIFLILLSFFMARKNKFLIAVIFFVFSILIKYASLFLLPVYIYLIYQKFFKKNVDWEKVYSLSFICMFLIFLLSPLREEMYPWYAVWFLPFISLTLTKWKAIFFIALTFALELRYIPYMLLATHFGITPYIKTTLTIGIPFITSIIYYFISKK